MYLTVAQLDRLKEHKYKSEGRSITESFMQIYWQWLVTKVPLWVAPNLITFIGLIINVVTTLPIVFLDPNAEGLAPRWAYITCAAGFFIYQSLDAIDGKQARRTGTSSPLGELFDHGCDAISMQLVMVSVVCALGLQSYPLVMLSVCLLLLELTFVYHWQTYVCGVLHFNKLDVTEAQFMHIAILLFSATFGSKVWLYKLPVLGYDLMHVLAVVVYFQSLVNMAMAFHIIFTRGVGKSGSTVADTSVLSPAAAPLIAVVPVVVSALYSPGSMLQTHAMLFISATCSPIVKNIITVIVSTMTKSPYPLLDSTMLGPLLVCANIFLGCPVPEVYLLSAVLVYNTVDILRYCVGMCREICSYLDISCFTIPHPPK